MPNYVGILNETPHTVSLYKVQHRLPLPLWDFWSTILSSLPHFPKPSLCPYFPPCSVWILCFIPKTTFLHNVQSICPHSLYFPGKTSTLMKLYRPATSPPPNSLPAPLSSGMRLGKDRNGAHPAEIPEPTAPPCGPAHCQRQVSLFFWKKLTETNKKVIRCIGGNQCWVNKKIYHVYRQRPN